jgi:2-polyprenyl-3-methyl-5-hydroxy-6-metoxy-1,4-benzoquinol methylase
MTVKTLQEHEAATLGYFAKDYRRKSLEALAIRFISGERVLEMRCLTGELSLALAQRKHEVYALDAFAGCVESTNALTERHGFGKDIARHWDMTGLLAITGPDRFDTVICFDVLNHVTDDEETVEEISQVLRPGGRLILLVPAHPSLHGKRDDRLGHLRRYDRAQLRGLLQRHGLEFELLRSWNTAALPFYAISEFLLKMDVSDKLRYAQDGPLGAALCPILRWWFLNVENRLLFPFGLSYFVLAQRSA